MDTRVIIVKHNELPLQKLLYIIELWQRIQYFIELRVATIISLLSLTCTIVSIPASANVPPSGGRMVGGKQSRMEWNFPEDSEESMYL